MSSSASRDEHVPLHVARLCSTNALQTFPKFLFKDDFTKPGPLKDALDSLFGSADYLSGVGTVCAGKPVLDPFQIGIMYV